MKSVVATVQKYQGYTTECCKELRDVCHIPVNYMQNLLVFIECAKDNPNQINRGAPIVEDIRVGKSIPDL